LAADFERAALNVAESKIDARIELMQNMPTSARLQSYLEHPRAVVPAVRVVAPAARAVRVVAPVVSDEVESLRAQLAAAEQKNADLQNMVTGAVDKMPAADAKQLADNYNFDLFTSCNNLPTDVTDPLELGELYDSKYEEPKFDGVSIESMAAIGEDIVNGVDQISTSLKINTDLCANHATKAQKHIRQCIKYSAAVAYANNRARRRRQVVEHKIARNAITEQKRRAEEVEDARRVVAEADGNGETGDGDDGSGDDAQ